MKLKQLQIWKDLIIWRSSKGCDNGNGKETYRIKDKAETVMKLFPFNIAQDKNES